MVRASRVPIGVHIVQIMVFLEPYGVQSRPYDGWGDSGDALIEVHVPSS